MVFHEKLFLAAAAQTRGAPMKHKRLIALCKHLKGGLGKSMYNTLELIRNLLWAMGKRETSNSVLFVTNLPWRGTARMAGVLCDAQVYALLDVINRKKGGWRKFFKATFSKK